jgi:DNA-directed RNA polymerase subunit RPC12/RpoP
MPDTKKLLPLLCPYCRNPSVLALRTFSFTVSHVGERLLVSPAIFQPDEPSDSDPEYRCFDCEAILTPDMLQLAAKHRFEFCAMCGMDAFPGSEGFQGRVIDARSAEERDKAGCAFPGGNYLCSDCTSELIEEKELDSQETNSGYWHRRVLCP